jgi:uncharacterized protein (DUF2267 family)
MSMTGVESFDTTLQKTHLWLNELMDELHWNDWDDRYRAYAALRATLHALRDRLSVEETAHLGAQLPMLIRGFYYEGWTPAGKPARERRKEEFLAPIQAHFRNDPDLDPERVARAVFSVLARRVTAGEIADVKSMLPKDLLELWPETVGG